MRADWTSGVRPPGQPCWAWWRRREHAPEVVAEVGDEAERLLDLASFADRRLADDDDRIAALIAADPDAAADVAAARALRGVVPPPADELVIARAAALVDEARVQGQIALFPPRRPLLPPVWRGATAWSSLAAAVVLAGWLGFNLGSDTRLLRAVAGHAFEDATAGGLLDAPPPLVRDFIEGWQT